MSIDLDYLKKMKEAGKENDSSSEGFVGKMTISFGFSGYVVGSKFGDYIRTYSDPNNATAVADKLNAELKRLSAFPAKFGLLTVINKDLVGKSYDNDLIDFITEYKQEDYNLLIAAVTKLNLPIDQEFWCRFQYQESPWSKAKGEEGKKVRTNKEGEEEKVYPLIRVPVEVFANEEAARAVVGDSRWSDTAKANYFDTNDINNLSGEILEWLEMAKEGTAYNNDAENFPLPVPPMPPVPKNIKQHIDNVKQYIATIYQIESSDIDQLISQSNPL